jgi:uncharacterized protein YjbJ (UPF0337 family)
METKQTSNPIKILKEDTMTLNISNKAEEKFKEKMNKDKANAGEQIDTSKLEAEGTCEIIVGKKQEKVCEAKT